jgi:hypothetical protein
MALASGDGGSSANPLEAVAKSPAHKNAVVSTVLRM